MNNEQSIQKIRAKLARLFKYQKFTVLSTTDAGQPYNSLVAFMASEDLTSVVFATERDTRKYANLSSDPRVSLLMDNRTNRTADFKRAMAVTALGTAREVGLEERIPLEKSFLLRFPDLREFVQLPTCALMSVEISKYYIVSRFQHMVVWEVL
ncbi:MAG: pyridoxamine 5'-phosphate oxidase family protein [Vulcanimicrobiota bacterium]